MLWVGSTRDDGEDERSFPTKVDVCFVNLGEEDGEEGEGSNVDEHSKGPSLGNSVGWY
jgi:hypothetical protein